MYCLIPKNHLIEQGTVKIKISGDGTRAGKKKHLVNFTFTIIGEETCKSEQGNYLLAIIRCPETNTCIKAALNGLIEEIDSLNEVIIAGETIKVEKYLGGDLKFLNQVTGMGGFASMYSFLWCKCPKDSRFDVKQKWSMVDKDQGAHTLDEISKCAKKKTFGCVAQPLQINSSSEYCS